MWEVLLFNNNIKIIGFLLPITFFFPSYLPFFSLSSTVFPHFILVSIQNVEGWDIIFMYVRTYDTSQNCIYGVSVNEKHNLCKLHQYDVV